MAPLVLAALFLLPPRGFGVALLAVIFVAAREWSRLAAFSGKWQWLYQGGIVAFCSGLLFLPAAGFDRGWPATLILVICGASALFWLLVAPFWVGQRWPTTGKRAMVLAGWIVLIGAWAALVELQSRSPWLVLAAMAIVWVADTAAYFSGRAFGRRKLAPGISPGKTWEGALGAASAVTIYGFVLSPALPAVLAANYALLLVVLVAITAIGIIGDLFESLLKRQAGLKDSSSILPGHGGVLDRIDSLTSTLPLVALVWLGTVY